MSKEKKKIKGANRQIEKKRRQCFRFMSCVAVLMLAVIGYGSSKSYAENKTRTEQKTQLLAELEEEQQRTAEIEKFREYAQTDEYVEEIAKEKLNMAYPEEVIFVPMD